MKFMRYISGLRKRPFVRDVLTIQAGSIVLMGASFVSSIAFAQLLGKETYGLYAVVLAFMGTVGVFFNIGQGQSLYVFFSEAYARSDRRAMSAVLANFLQIALINIVLLGVLAIVMPMLSDYLYGTPEIGRMARILCFFQMSEIVNSMTLILLQSLRRIRYKVILEQAANLSFLGTAVIVLLLGGKIHAILLTQLCVSLVFLPISLFTLQNTAKKYKLPGLREALRIPFRESRQYMGQGFIITTDKTISNFFPQSLLFLLSLTSPVAFIGTARIAIQLASIPRSILLPQAGDLSTTAFAKMKAQGADVLRKNAALLIKHALGFHAVLTFGAMLVAPPVILWFYGPEFWDAIPMTLWLLLILLLSSLTLANSPLLRLYRKMELSIVTNIGSWAIMAAIIFGLRTVLPTETIFLLAFSVFYAFPIVLTVWIFRSLLQSKSESL